MSFSQEIKDFTAGFQATADIMGKKEDRKLKAKELDFDMSYKSALLEIQQQELGLKKQAAALKGGSGGSGGTGGKGAPKPMTEYQAAQLALSERRVAAAEAADKRAAAKAESIEMNAAVGADPYPVAEDPIPTEEEDTGYNPDEYETEYAKGGMVQKFATGGAVAAVPAEEEEPAVAPLGAIPASPVPPARPAAPVTPGGTPAAAPAAAPAPAAKPENPAVTMVVREAGKAADAAIREFTVQQSKPRTAVGPDSQMQGPDLVTGKGGITDREYGEILKTIDPNGSIPKHLEGAAAMGSVYNYFIEKGEPDKAKTAAQKIMVANKTFTQTLGALAMNAIDEGNPEAACQLLNDACNKFPSGSRIEVTPDDKRGLVYSVFDQNDELLSEGFMNVSQAYEFAGQVQNGSLYLSEVAKFAAGHAPENEEGGGWLSSIGNALGIGGEEEATAPSGATRGNPRPAAPAAAAPAIPTAAPAAPAAAPAPTPAPAAAPPAGVAQPKSKADYDALPSGTMYVAPDGTTKRKS